MRYIFSMFIVATLLTACQKKQAALPDTTPDIKTLLAYPDAEVFANITTKTGGVLPVTWKVAKNTSHPTDQPANLTFRGSPVSHDGIEVSWVCYGRFREGDIYAFSVGTNNGKMTLPLQEVACVFNGKEMLVLNTNEVNITIKPQ